jgi:hypothetical protein
MHKGEIEMFIIRGLHKYAEEDNFELGGGLGENMQSYIDMTFTGETVEEVIKSVGDFVSSEDHEINACEEIGRVDFVVNETIDGIQADESDWAKFRAGKQRQWYCTYTGTLEEIKVYNVEEIK